MARIFVSYSRKNLDTVKKLAKDLEDGGNPIWLDQAELTGGQKWWDNILANIRECDVFAIALTPESLESSYCKQELKYAIQLGKSILPIRLLEIIKPNQLPPSLSQFHVVDYLQQNRETALAVVKALRNDKTIKYRIGIARDTGWGACYNDAG